MKKEIIIAIIIFVFVIALNTITEKCTDSSLADVSSELNIIRENLKSENKNELNSQISNAIEKWYKEKEKLVIYIEHDELEKVEQYLLEANSNIETEEYAIAIQAIDTCNFIIEHIKDKYEFSLKNIF